MVALANFFEFVKFITKSERKKFNEKSNRASCELWIFRQS